MKAIIYEKGKSRSAQPTLIEFDVSNREVIQGTLTANGRVILLPKSEFDKVRSILASLNYKDLEEKHKKVELTRALRLRSGGMQPRYLRADFASTGSFKRSFEPFLKSNYQAEDPVCIIFLPDAIHEEIAKGAGKQSVRKSASAGESSHTAFLAGWVAEISGIKEVSVLEESYLGNSFSAFLIRALIYRAAHDSTPVVITGETGTGKNLIAQLIHDLSDRKKQKFVTVNCSAIPDTLFESEVFGHVKGAFTDAQRETTGLFELANGGTLFLDEIGDLALNNQAKLLHAVDTGEFRKVGSEVVRKCNVRLVAATGYDLPFQINDKKFRMDLFYRLKSFRILVKPLREHPDDIPLLANTFWSTKNNQFPLTTEILDYLKRQPWYGNVRELYMTLSNLHTMFGDRRPSLEALECLQWMNSEQSIQVQTERADFDGYMKNESKYRLDKAMVMIREIRIKLRPLINHEKLVIHNQRKIKEIKLYVINHTDLLDELCKDPLFFKDLELYNLIRIFRFNLEQKLTDPRFSAVKFHKVWMEELEKLYEEILRRIFGFFW